MKNDPQDKALEELFAVARENKPDVSDHVTKRLIDSVPNPTRTRRDARIGEWSGFRSWVPALGGLGAVTALGVWIGIAVPTAALFEFNDVTDVGVFDLTTFYSGADWSALAIDEVGL